MTNLRRVLRGIRNEPLTVFAMVAALSVGLGAGAAVFAFLDHIWLVPLPYAEADRIVQIWERWPETPDERPLGVSYPHYQTLLESSRSLDEVALYSTFESEASHRDLVIQAQTARVTPRFFPLLGVEPSAGRWLSSRNSENPEDEAVISRRLWRRLFGSQELNGQLLGINGRDYSIVGIMPERLSFPGSPTDVWLPHRPPPPEEAANRYSRCLAKRRSGVANEQAAAEVERFFDRSSARVNDLWDEMYGKLQTPLKWLGGGIGLILLVALLNAATLQFARLSRRWKDYGIRVALGARTRHLAGELLLESLLPASVGAVLGFVFFSAAFAAVTRNWPGEIPGIHDFSLWAPRPLLLLLMEALASALTLGGLSLWFVRRLRTLDRLNMGKESGPLSPFRLRLNGLVVSAQFTAAVVLLICAGMLTRSFIDGVTVDLGYQPEGVLAAQMWLPEERYPNREAQRQAVDALRDRLRSLDGVKVVGFSSTLPVVGGSEMTIQIPDSDLVPKVAWAQVTPSYFEALGLRLIDGALLPARASGEPAVVVNQSLAKAYLGSQPLRKTIRLGPDKPYRVVGVVQDVLHDGYLGRPEAGLYFHYLQPPSGSFLHDLDHGHLILRLAVPPSSFAANLQSVVKSQDSEIRLNWVRPMTEILAENFAEPRFWTVLAVCLSLLALAFSMLALYALMSYNVSLRIPELAVRMTLGATPHEITRLVMRQAIGIIGRGLLAGVVLSLIVSALFADLIFGVARLQALTWLICLVLLSGAALLAAYLPTRRGAETDPALCLKSGL